MVTKILFDNCFNVIIKTNLAVVLPSNLLEPQGLATTDKDNTLGENAMTISFIQERNLPDIKVDSYLGPRPKQDTRAELKPTQGLVKQLCLSIWELVKQLCLYIQYCPQHLVLQTRQHTLYRSCQPIYPPLPWPPVNEAVEIFSLLRGDCHGKWLEDVDISIVARIGLIQSLGEHKPS